MLNAQDMTSTINEPKSQRKDLRFKPLVIDVINAPQAVGMDSNTFIPSGAYRAAQKIEAAQHKTVVPADAFDAFANVVDRLAEDNPALAALFERRKALLEDD